MQGHLAAHRGLLAATEGLDARAWSTPTGCPGWDVHDQLAHCIGTERMMLDDAPAAVAVDGAGHVRNDLGRLVERVDVARESALRALAASLPSRLGAGGTVALEVDGAAPVAIDLGDGGVRRPLATAPVVTLRCTTRQLLALVGGARTVRRPTTWASRGTAPSPTPCSPPPRSRPSGLRTPPVTITRCAPSRRAVV
ncbi:maleylpyruvate isomerase N-terminal domain-containing protein [Egicoccus sp. AB-alg2]|uniref:maleylpyruvate isomerase N-terminal domain-containing protein n=1 Tax=Egicoccus sp. AB-alg2 TaxID=3242693 RepID=UPI00359DF21C